MPDNWQGVTLARILRARGRRGEVAAEILTDFPARLPHLKEVWLWDGKNPPRRAALRACWLHNHQAIFHVEGCDSIDAAEKLRGLEVQVPLSERVALPQRSYYVTDLIGCEIWELKEVEEVEDVKEKTKSKGTSASSLSSTSLGLVRDVQFTGGTPVLAVQTKRGEVLIPLAEAICRRIDVKTKRIEVALPEGLLELNQEVKEVEEGKEVKEQDTQT